MRCSIQTLQTDHFDMMALLQLSISYLSCCCPLVAPLLQNNGQQRLGWTVSLFKREFLHEWTISMKDISGMEYKIVLFDDELSLSIVCFSVATKSPFVLFHYHYFYGYMLF